MYKLNDLRTRYHITAYGFSAFIAYAETSVSDGEEIVISTLSPAVMAERGITMYYAPVLPRGAVYKTAEEVEAADLSVNLVTVYDAPDDGYGRVLIVSRHQGTIDILRKMYPDAEIMYGNVTADALHGGLVVGTLPPVLIAECTAYQAVTIDGFDHTKDGDLSGDALQARLHISRPISITIK